MSFDFETELKNKTARVEEIVSFYLPKPEGYASTVMEAMNYSAMAGGKRLRPLMIMEANSLVGGDGKLIGPFMAALEMIHNYSLVHDDLPAMDNDELRRGMPTTWVKYGDGMAVLAGDALLNYSMETAVKAFELTDDFDETKRIAWALKVLFGYSGIYGMIGGQCADLEAEKKGMNVSKDNLLYIHENKTAALIRAALVIGAILGGADKETVDKLTTVGFNIGIAFQIQDDILDVISTSDELGKPVGSDERNEKATYVSLEGLDASKAEVLRLSNEAMDILASFENRNLFLEELVKSLISRRK